MAGKRGGDNGWGSGIHTGDINGDGRVEWALVAPPDLYVFSSVEPDHYEPVWRAQAASTQRPFIGDLNGDGRDELAFNGEGQGVIVSLRSRECTAICPCIHRGLSFGFDARAGRMAGG